MNATPTDRLFGVVAGHGPAATKLVAKALSVASQAHHGQFRRSGDPYITHPVAVAATVADLGADIDTIVTALLHDVPCHTAHTLEQLRAEFGDRIGDLLAAFARINQADFFDDMTGVDPQAVTLKIADRLHNMQTIQCLEKSVQQRKANQTRQLVAPLARSLGLAGIAAELDALATRTLGNPITRLDPTVHAHTQHAPDAGIRAAHSLLRAAARVLLPGQCRERWLAEWDGELHALPSRRHRLAFIADLLLGLPSMALHARHTRQIHDGDDQ